MYYTAVPSPVGQLLLLSDGICLTGLSIDSCPEDSWQRQDDLPLFARTKDWLRAYFEGCSPDPEILPLKASGTSFQREVWQLLMEIPYGKTTTYGKLAREMARITGKEKMSAQAVGQAVGSNPISIIIPCHRVVGAKGKLTGYAWGVAKKEWLLKHEGSR